MAHPERDRFVQAATIKERTLQMQEAARRLDTEFTWICDAMDNRLKHWFGNRNNSEFVIAPGGEVLVGRAWSDPQRLREDLGQLVGEPESVTTIGALGRDPKGALPEAVQQGVVPRIERPGTYIPVRVVPRPSDEDTEATKYYAKPRVEMEDGFFESGEGKLYIGFHLDPVYPVHWNNLAPPLKFSLACPEGIQLESDSWEAAKPDVESDIDPREFLIALTSKAGRGRPAPIVLSVEYYACDDGGQWCTAFQQEYEITLEADRDAGRVSSGRRGGMRPGRGRQPQPGGDRGGGMTADRALERMDRNKDGKIAKDEVMGRMKERFPQIDKDGDGMLDRSELEGFLGNVIRGRGAGDR